MNNTAEATFYRNLSSVLQTALTSLQTVEFTDTTTFLLSAVQQLSSIQQITQLDSLVNELTSIPLHPYQHLLWQHFEPEHKFKTIDDIPEPVSLPSTKECIDFITKKERALCSTMHHNLTCCPEVRIASGFEYLSGDNVVCDMDRQKNYLEFFEMVRQIPADTITQENANVIIKKIVSEYMKVI